MKLFQQEISALQFSKRIGRSLEQVNLWCAGDEIRCRLTMNMRYRIKISDAELYEKGRLPLPDKLPPDRSRQEGIAILSQAARLLASDTSEAQRKQLVQVIDKTSKELRRKKGK
jgi:hypothetical protein